MRPIGHYNRFAFCRLSSLWRVAVGVAAATCVRLFNAHQSHDNLLITSKEIRAENGESRRAQHFIAQSMLVLSLGSHNPSVIAVVEQHY